MNSLSEVVKDLAILAMLMIAFGFTFLDQWDKATFFMAMTCYSVLVRRG